MIRRTLLAAAIVVGLVAALAAPAAAHVSVNADDATQGAFTKITFLVPNEEDAADTTQVVVQLPTDHPIPSVTVEPKTGWTYQVQTTPLPKPIQTDDGEVTEAVSTITWTGGSIKPGEFDEFEISGPLPTDTDTLVFKALQTYSDGTVVRWIDPPAPGGAEPEHPAATLHLTAATGSAEGPATGTAAATSDDDSDTLGIVGIVVGGLGLVAAITALALRNKRPTGPTG
jgi:uncharacterized protein YcnI